MGEALMLKLVVCAVFLHASFSTTHGQSNSEILLGL